MSAEDRAAKENARMAAEEVYAQILSNQPYHAIHDNTIDAMLAYGAEVRKAAIAECAKAALNELTLQGAPSLGQIAAGAVNQLLTTAPLPFCSLGTATADSFFVNVVDEAGRIYAIEVVRKDERMASVPREPTAEMIWAGACAEVKVTTCDGKRVCGVDGSANIYKAMLNAAKAKDG